MWETLLTASQQLIPPFPLLEGPHSVWYPLSGQTPQGGGSPWHQGIGTIVVTSFSVTEACDTVPANTREKKSAGGFQGSSLPD